MDKKDAVLKKLDDIGANYKIIYHEEVHTIEDMILLRLHEYGEIAKNLFLRDYKGKRHFLVISQKDKTVDLKALRHKIGSTPLSFASDERLEKYLGLKKGAVTIFGILNDEAHEVEVIFDQDLKDNPCLGFHPNDNTATVFLSFNDIKKIIEESGNELKYIEI